MKITNISAQVRNPDRVNVSIDGKYRLSLDIAQVTELGVRVGKELSDLELQLLEQESQFGKLYQRTLEYALLRPRSLKEISDYLWRKTLTTKKQIQTVSRSGEVSYRVVEKPGYTKELAERVKSRLIERGYIDDEQFSRWWVDNRNVTKGSSARKLQAELRAKGVDNDVISAVLADSDRTDRDELAKVIAKKHSRYADEQKFKQYLARQGFSFDDINQALSDELL